MNDHVKDVAETSQRKMGVVLNYICEAVRVATGLVYTPLMLRILGQSEYGLYQLVGSTVAYLSLLSLGFGSAYVRYHSRYQVKEDREGIDRLNGMFMSIFCVMAVVCLLCGGAMAANVRLIFGTGLTEAELAKARVLLAILIVNMALTFPNSVFNCYIAAHEQFAFQRMLALAQSALNPFLTLPLLLLGYGSVAVVLISTALTIASFSVNILFCLKKLKMQFNFRGMEVSLLKEMSVFTFFIFLNQIIDQVNWSVDKFLLGRMNGTVAVAIYGVGGQLNSLFLQMSTSVSSVFAPKVNRIVAKTNDSTELTMLMIRVGRIQFIILSLVLSGFAFFGKNFISLWAGEEYTQSYLVALLLMTPVTVPLIQNIGIEIQRAKNMHKARSLVYFYLAVINVFLSVLLIPQYGCVGAAAGTAISLVMGNGIFMNWYYHKRIGLDMILFWKSIATIVPGLVIPIIFGFILNMHPVKHNWVTLIVMIVVYTFVYCLSMYRFGMNEEEKQLIYPILRKIRLMR